MISDKGYPRGSRAYSAFGVQSAYPATRPESLQAIVKRALKRLPALDELDYFGPEVPVGEEPQYMSQDLKSIGEILDECRFTPLGRKAPAPRQVLEQCSIELTEYKRQQQVPSQTSQEKDLQSCQAKVGVQNTPRPQLRPATPIGPEEAPGIFRLPRSRPIPEESAVRILEYYSLPAASQVAMAVYQVPKVHTAPQNPGQELEEQVQPPCQIRHRQWGQEQSLKPSSPSGNLSQAKSQSLAIQIVDLHRPIWAKLEAEWRPLPLSTTKTQVPQEVPPEPPPGPRDLRRDHWEEAV